LSDESCSGAAIEGLVRFIYAGNLRVHGALDLVQLFRVSRFLQVIPPSYSLQTAFVQP
jgi:hypothetical protein